MRIYLAKKVRQKLNLNIIKFSFPTENGPSSTTQQRSVPELEDELRRKDDEISRLQSATSRSLSIAVTQFQKGQYFFQSIVEIFIIFSTSKILYSLSLANGIFLRPLPPAWYVSSFLSDRDLSSELMSFHRLSSVFSLSFFCFYTVFLLSFFCLFTVFLLSYFCLFVLSFFCIFTPFLSIYGVYFRAH